MKLTNKGNINVGLAVWLATDGYSMNPADSEPIPEGKLISATTLLKPTRQLVLRSRLDPEEQELDIADLVASRFGHALHDSVEKAWASNYQRALHKLGYPDKMIESIIINPKPEEVTPDIIPVYLERRAYKQIGDYVITGQLDMIIQGSLIDTKSTSTFSYIKGNKDDDYAWQGSIYRWLNPELITSDVMRINFIFTDWQRFRAVQDPEYPQRRVETIEIKLYSLEETEEFIKNKLREYEFNLNLPEENIIRCTDKELWRGDTTYKYYSNAERAYSGGRATKNFNTDKAGAYRHQAEQGKGVVIEFPGKVKACTYCEVFDSCSQQKEYEHD